MKTYSIFGMEQEQVIPNYFMKVKKGSILSIRMMECGEEVFISPKMPVTVWVIHIIIKMELKECFLLKLIWEIAKIYNHKEILKNLLKVMIVLLDKQVDHKFTLYMLIKKLILNIM